MPAVLTTKEKALRKRLIVESTTIGSVLLVLMIALFFVAMLRDGYVESNSKLEGQSNGIEVEVSTLRGKYSNILKNAALYQEVQNKQTQNRLAINRQAVLDKFNQFKNECNLDNMRLSMSAVQDLKDLQYKRKTSAVNYSEVTVNAEAMTDENVFKLLQIMQEQLPGVSRVEKLSLQLDRPLNDEVLKGIVQKGSWPLVKTEVRFVWYGINPIDTTEASDAAKKKP